MKLITDGTKEYERIMMLREISQVETRMESAHELLHQAWKNIGCYRQGCSQDHLISREMEGKLKQLDDALVALCEEYLRVIERSKQYFIDELHANGLNVGAWEIMDSQATGLVEGFGRAAVELIQSIQKDTEKKDD